MTLNQLVENAHRTAKEKGWHDPDIKKTPLECHMLMVSEIAEASEEVRSGNPYIYFNTPTGRVSVKDLGGSVSGLQVGDVLQKPEGEAIELVDCLLRIADYFGEKGWDLEAAVKAKLNYNITRPHRHGGKLK